MKLLDDFWMWLEMSPEQYSEIGVDLKSSKCEFHYPKFEELLCYVRRVACQKVISNDEIEDILTIMALDNETEDVLDFLVDNLPDCHMNALIEKGLHHLQWEARWQLAELIYRRRFVNCEHYLQILTNDTMPYVRKRAKNCLKYMKQGTVPHSTNKN